MILMNLLVPFRSSSLDLLDFYDPKASGLFPEHSSAIAEISHAACHYYFKPVKCGHLVAKGSNAVTADHPFPQQQVNRETGQG